MKNVSDSRMGGWILLAIGLTLLIPSFGCQKRLEPVMTPTEMAAEPPPILTLGPGDVLDVKFFYAPELNENQTVRPDGKITLQLVGDVEVTGKTPSELREALSQAYIDQLKKPEVSVIVRSLSSRRIYVGGEVKNPGLLSIPSPLTVLEAVMQAGGFNFLSGDTRNIVVIRQKDGKHYGTVLDYRNALEGKVGQAFYVQPLDIVYVSSTQITDVNRWIDQNINKVIPAFMQVILTKPVGDGTLSVGATGTR